MKDISQGKGLGAKTSITGIVFLIPALIFMVYAVFTPFVWNFILSFQEWDGFLNKKWVLFENYITALKDQLVLKSLYNSVFLAVSITAGSVILGVTAAVFLYKVSKREGPIYRLILFIPVMMPMAVIGLLFTFIYNPTMGIINNFFNLIGLDSFSNAWLEDKRTVMICIAIVGIYRMTGLTMILCYASMQMLPVSLFESCKLDGAGYMRQVFHIILPLIKPIIQLATVYTLATNFKTYDLVFILTGGGPGDTSKTIPINMIETAFNYSKFGYAAAMGVLLTIVVVFVIFIVNKLLGGETYEY
jgi:raffinose/stachyose/melibiose transport system permease protein